MAILYLSSLLDKAERLLKECQNFSQETFLFLRTNNRCSKCNLFFSINIANYTGHLSKNWHYSLVWQLSSLNDNRCLLNFLHWDEASSHQLSLPQKKFKVTHTLSHLAHWSTILPLLVFTDKTQPRISISLLAWGQSKSSLLNSCESAKDMPVLSILVLSPFEKVDPVSISLENNLFIHVKYCL